MPKYIISCLFGNIITADNTKDIEDKEVENQTKGE